MSKLNLKMLLMVISATACTGALAYVPPIVTGRMELYNETASTLQYASNAPVLHGKVGSHQDAKLQWATISGGVKVYVAGCTISDTQPNGVVKGNAVNCYVENSNNTINVKIEPVS